MTCPTCGAEPLRSGTRYWCPACGTLVDWPGSGFAPEVSVPKLVKECREMQEFGRLMFRDGMADQWRDFIAPLINPE